MGKTKKPCPTCGKCPTCGSQEEKEKVLLPYIGYPYPYITQPAPFWPLETIICSGGTNGES